MTLNAVYSTQVTQWFINAQQAVVAGGPTVDLADGHVVVGDGNGVVPTLSQLIANGGVLHQVWSGAINSVAADSANTAQIDVGVVIPAIDSSGVEIGPFNVTEFAIYEKNGNLCLVGTTNLQKTTSVNGQTVTLQFFACYVEQVANSVSVAPPQTAFTTLAQCQAALANIVTGKAPIAVTKSTDSSGWTDFMVSAAPAALAADPIASASDLGKLGVGRPATAAEFAAGAAAAGAGFALPWPTIQQVVGAVNGLIAGYAMTSSAESNSFYIRFKNGLIVQGGSEAMPTSETSTSVSKTIVFPIAFPNLLCGAIASAMGASNATNGNFPAAGAGTTSKSGCVLIVDNNTGGQANAYPINEAVWVSWLAFGN